jgi:cell division septation protein DedD
VAAPEPRTHYQVSFTSRQAVLLFVLVLVSLAGAYFLGLLTGLAGRPPAENVAAAEPAPVSTATAVAAAARVPETPDTAAAPSSAAPRRTLPGEAPTRAPALAAREPGTAGDLQFFEDQKEDSSETTPAPPGKKAAVAAPMGPGWWVQVLATSSEREAKSRRTALQARGYHAAVETMRGVKGPTQYRVRVGPYASREEAGRAKDVLARQEKANPWIVPPGQ